MTVDGRRSEGKRGEVKSDGRREGEKRKGGRRVVESLKYLGEGKKGT